MSVIKEKLAALEKQMHNRSPKPLARLKASLAYHEHQNLIKSLPGSAKRGLARGKEV